jgi:hypothetical protein
LSTENAVELLKTGNHEGLEEGREIHEPHPNLKNHSVKRNLHLRTLQHSTVETNGKVSEDFVVDPQERQMEENMLDTKAQFYCNNPKLWHLVFSIFSLQKNLETLSNPYIA